MLEAGGSEDEVIAALLHDGPEDRGGLQTLEEIRLRFGEAVAEIVAECSDSFDAQKQPWKRRKLDYLRRLESVSTSALLVSCADKLHNARSIIADYQTLGMNYGHVFAADGRDALVLPGAGRAVRQERCAAVHVR